MRAVGTVVATAAAMAFCMLVNGAALQRLWAWFACTTFGAAPLSLAAAAGLGRAWL